MRVKITTDADIEEDSSLSAGRFEELDDGDEADGGSLLKRICFICNSPGKKECEAYPGRVHYCCEDHRLMHHPYEQKEPYPFVVMHKESVGR